MMKELKTTTWDGYNFDELKYVQAVTLAKIDLEKERLSMKAERLKKGNLLFAPGAFTKILSLINYTDFLVFGVKFWRKISPLFRKKRR